MRGRRTASSCVLKWDIELQAYTLQCSFSADFIALLKGMIPSAKRSYNEATKTWFFEEEYFTPVRLCVLKFFPYNNTIIDRATEEAHNAKRVADAQKAAHQAYSTTMMTQSTLTPREAALLKLAKILPLESLERAYKHAATQLHPDVNSTSAVQMAALNAAWTELKKLI